MQINLYQFEVLEAIAQYCKKEHDVNLDTDSIDDVSIEYQERERVYKKHKNGRNKMNEHGYPEVDWDKSPLKTKWISFSELDELHISVIARGDV